MGATSSKVYVTDWNKADGGTKQHFETLDHMTPFREHHTLVLLQKTGESREFCVVDEQGTLLYESKAVPTTAFWFDLLRNHEPIVEVRGHPWGNEWDIYTYRHAAFSGQEPTKTVTGDPILYLKARVVINWKQDRANVQYYQTDKAGHHQWSEPTLVYEDVNFIQGKGQTHREGHNDLISYFEWKKPGQELRMEVAKGCDTAVHVVLSVIANMVHTNTNPFMASTTDDYMK